jgi:hypothetical protein
MTMMRFSEDILPELQLESEQDMCWGDEKGYAMRSRGYYNNEFLRRITTSLYMLPSGSNPTPECTIAQRRNLSLIGQLFIEKVARPELSPRSGLVILYPNFREGFQFMENRDRLCPP